MLINLRNALMAGKRKPTARDYLRAVPNAIVAMWDSIENTGFNQHSDTLTTWKDLTGNGYDMVVNSAATVGADYISGDGIWIARFSTSQINFMSASVVGVLPDSQSAMSKYLFCGQSAAGTNFVYVQASGDAAMIGISQKNTNNQNYAGVAYPSGTAGSRVGIHVNYGIGRTLGATDCHINGIEQTITLGGSTPYNNAGSFFAVGTRLTRQGTPTTNFNFGANVSNIRLYSRALTAAEIAANYAIDKERFNLP